MPGFCQFFHDFQTKFPGRSNDLPHVPINDSAEQKTRGYWESGNGQLLSLIGPRWPPRILRPHCDPRDRSFTASSGQPARRWRRFGGHSRKISVVPIDPSCTICAVLVRNGVKSMTSRTGRAGPRASADLHRYLRIVLRVLDGCCLSSSVEALRRRKRLDAGSDGQFPRFSTENSTVKQTLLPGGAFTICAGPAFPAWTSWTLGPRVADKILNHPSGTISGVAAVYKRHEFLAAESRQKSSYDRPTAERMRTGNECASDKPGCTLPSFRALPCR